MTQDDLKKAVDESQFPAAWKPTLLSLLETVYTNGYNDGLTDAQQAIINTVSNHEEN